MKEQKCPNCGVTIYGDGMGFLPVEAEMALHKTAHSLFRSYVQFFRRTSSFPMFRFQT
jgi:hypothetical protein